MSVQPIGQQQQQQPYRPPQHSYAGIDAKTRAKIRTGGAPDPWETNRYQRSETGRYDIRNDPNRAVNRADTQNEVEGSFDYDIRQRRILDQAQVNEATALQGSIMSAWNRERDRQEGEFASLYAQAEQVGARPYNTGSGGWAFEQLDASGTGEIRNRIVNAAMSMAQNSNLEYSWGGGGAAGPSYGINANGFTAADEYGFDCSGLVQYAYARAGIDIGRHSTAQTTAGRIVPLDQLQPGDLVGWGSSPQSATHVAVYLGNGMIAEFANDRDNNRVRSINQGWGFDEQAFGISIIRN